MDLSWLWWCWTRGYYMWIISDVVIGDNVEITVVNRPEGRILDWLYDPMCIMKEQIKSLNLQKAEELYFRKLCLYNGDTRRMESWQNGGFPPQDNIRRAQLEGTSRRYIWSFILFPCFHLNMKLFQQHIFNISSCISIIFFPDQLLPLLLGYKAFVWWYQGYQHVGVGLMK